MGRIRLQRCKGYLAGRSHFIATGCGDHVSFHLSAFSMHGSIHIVLKSIKWALKKRKVVCAAPVSSWVWRYLYERVYMIYMIRHGKTDKNTANVLQGRSDTPLFCDKVFPPFHPTRTDQDGPRSAGP